MRPPNESREMQGKFDVSIRLPRPSIQTAEWDLTRIGHIGGFIRRFRNRRSNRQIDPRDKNQLGMNGGFGTADQNRRKLPDASGLIWRFHSAARPPIQTAVSPKMVKPREKPRAFSNGDLRAKIGTKGACVDVSEQQLETNYKTHEHTKA